MDINVIIQAILALGTIIGGGVAAYATYRSTNSSVKVQEKQIGLEEQRIKKELGSFGVEEAERISNISLSNLQFMQQLVTECGNERAALRAENNRLTLEVTQREVRTMKKLAKLKDISERLSKLEISPEEPCYQAVNTVIDILNQLITELEGDTIR